MRGGNGCSSSVVSGSEGEGELLATHFMSVKQLSHVHQSERGQRYRLDGELHDDVDEGGRLVRLLWTSEMTR